MRYDEKLAEGRFSVSVVSPGNPAGRLIEKEGCPMPKPATERRLWDAFAAECAAYMKYTFYAQAAKQEGYQQIAAVFEQTAENEKAHARLWLLALGAFPDGTCPGDTLKNLRAAAEGERSEYTVQYKECAADAKKEGETRLIAQFEGVAAVEASHERRFRELIQHLEQNQVFLSPDDPNMLWRCRFCGHRHMGPQAPEACPVCGYPKGFFERKLSD